MPSNTRLHTELLITAGVRGLDRIDAVIEALRTAEHNTDQLTDESARLRAEWWSSLRTFEPCSDNQRLMFRCVAQHVVWSYLSENLQ